MNIEECIKQKVTEELSPKHFELINDSDKHVGHKGHDGSGQSHFKLIVVSSRFEGCSRIQKHRIVYDVLDDLFVQGLHALSINAMSLSEYNPK